MDFKDLTPEQQEKLAACKTPEEILALAKAEGVDLTEEQMGAISGGSLIGFQSYHLAKSGAANW